MIRDFAKNLVEIHAYSNGQAVPIEKVDKSTWACRPVSGVLHLEYDVYAWDLSVRSAHLDTTHGFFNGTSVFVCVNGQEEEACSVEICTPAAPLEDWQVATAMRSTEINTQGFGHYVADNYDELIDHPVEMGRFTRHVFEAGGVPHELILTGQFSTDVARICADLKVICEHHLQFFGGEAPFDHYLFLVMVVGEGYGGLEHRSSTSLITSRESLPVQGDTAISDAYLEFLGLCSHEYFHNWNVKRIKPAVFVPYQLEKESYTRLLWAFEGITSYYDDLALVRSGLIDHERYLGLLAKTLSRVYQGTGRHKQSVSDSSFDAWTKFYKQDENAPNAIVSYYTKGALIALALDLTIRFKTEGRRGLDDVMLALWEEFGIHQQGVGEKVLEEKIAEYTGVNLSAFFDTALRGTEDIALAPLLKQVGVELTWGYASEPLLNGREERQLSAPLALGLKMSGSDSVKVTHVFDGGAAQKAGISAGDELLAFDGLRVTPKKLDQFLKRCQQGQSVVIIGFRRDELMTFTVVLQQAEKNTPLLKITGQSPERDAWLSRKDT